MWAVTAQYEVNAVNTIYALLYIMTMLRSSPLYQGTYKVYAFNQTYAAFNNFLPMIPCQRQMKLLNMNMNVSPINDPNVPIHTITHLATRNYAR